MFTKYKQILVGSTERAWENVWYMFQIVNLTKLKISTLEDRFFIILILRISQKLQIYHKLKFLKNVEFVKKFRIPQKLHKYRILNLKLHPSPRITWNCTIQHNFVHNSSWTYVICKFKAKCIEWLCDVINISWQCPLHCCAPLLTIINS